MEGGRSEATRAGASEERTQVAELGATDGGDLATALDAQKRRVLAALEETGTIEAAPIVRAGERFSCEGYETLVYEHHHVHLYELEAAGLVEFDRRADEVRRGPRFDERLSFLEHGDRCPEASRVNSRI